MSEEITQPEEQAKPHSSLVSFRDAFSPLSVVSVTRHIRDLIREVLYAEDEVLWESILPYLQNPGSTGSTQFDHARIAFAILSAQPRLSEVKGLNEKAIYDHTVAVMKQRGFIYSRGYIAGHVKDSQEGIESNDSSQEPDTTSE